jgi:hypothetical protein
MRARRTEHNQKGKEKQRGHLPSLIGNLDSYIRVKMDLRVYKETSGSSREYLQEVEKVVKDYEWFLLALATCRLSVALQDT